MAQRDPGHSRQIWLGIGILAVCHLLLLWVSWFDVGGYGIYPFYFIGVTQGIYVIPGIIIAAVLKGEGVLQGLLLGAGVTLLLNFAVCGGIMVYSSLPR